MMQFTEAQREAIENLDRGLSVLAAAGSGKTRVLVERYARLLASGIEPARILTVTFTREAAEQLRERTVALLAADVPLAEKVRRSPSIGTIHSFCLQLLKRHGGEIESPREILDDVRWHECFEGVFEKWFSALDSALLQQGLKYWNPQDLEALCKEALHQSLVIVPFLKKKPTVEGMENWWHQTLPSLYATWQRDIVGNGIYSFTDLEAKALELLENPQIRLLAQTSYSAFLIDEFQDTSPAQWQILEKVIGSQWNKVFIVGDPRQSIYGFRNADAELFFSVKDHLCKVGGKKIELATCFRSTPEVVEAVNRISQRVFPSERAYVPLISGRTSEKIGPGLHTVAYAAEGTRSAELSQSEIGSISRYLRQRIFTDTAELDAPGPADFALLFRNSDRIADFAAALETEGIAARYRKGERLFDHYFTWDVLHFFKTVLDPQSDFLLSSFLLSPFVGMTGDGVQALQQERGTSLLDRLERRKDSFTAWLLPLIKNRHLAPAMALERLVAASGYWPSRYPCWDSLAKLLAESETIQSAVKKLELAARNDVLGSSPAEGNPKPSVSLLTIHAAKGLEFKEVLLVDLLRRPSTRYPWLVTDSELGFGVRFRQDGEIQSSPLYEQMYERRSLKENEEEMRLLYVALTRAKDRILLSLPEDKGLIKGACWGALLHESMENKSGDEPLKPCLNPSNVQL